MAVAQEKGETSRGCGFDSPARQLESNQATFAKFPLYLRSPIDGAALPFTSGIEGPQLSVL